MGTRLTLADTDAVAAMEQQAWEHFAREFATTREHLLALGWRMVATSAEFQRVQFQRQHSGLRLSFHVTRLNS